MTRMHPEEERVRFCPRCGTAVEPRIPEGEDRERPVCPRCDLVTYVNPKVVVGCVVEHRETVLMCRRAIEPAKGRWTLPGGYLELHESAVEGALRETREEALAEVEVVAPHAFLDVPNISQMYAIFRANLVEPSFGPGAESLEVRQFKAEDVPWDELSFPVVHFALRLWADDLRAGRRDVHVGVVRWNGEGSRWDSRQYALENHIATPVVVGS
jgi:ADP-ribose/FAD diphosphatase